MRIVILLEYYRPFNYATSGVIVSIETLTKGLIQRGHQVLWILPQGSDYPPFEIEVRHFPVFPNLTKMPIRSLSPSFVELVRIAEEFRPEIVHAHNPFVSFFCAKLMARVTHCKVFFTAHTMLPAYVQYSAIPFPGLSKIAKYWMRGVCTASDVVIVPSQTARRYIRKIGFSGEPLVVPTGVDTSMFSPVDLVTRNRLRSGFGVAPDDFVVLYCGRLSLEKNIYQVINSMKLLSRPSVRLLMLGDGPLLQGLRVSIQDERIVLKGPVEHAQLADYYRMSDCLVHPAVTEFQGLVVLEALASGLPVIVPIGSAQAEFVSDGENGILVEREQEALTGAIKYLMDNSIHHLHMRESARHTVSRFDIGTFAETMEAAYRTAISR